MPSGRRSEQSPRHCRRDLVGSGKWPEAGDELAEYLKSNPTDGLNQYRYGVSIFSQLQVTLANLQALNNDAKLAQLRNRDLGPYIDRLNARTRSSRLSATLRSMLWPRRWRLADLFELQRHHAVVQTEEQRFRGWSPAVFASKKAELAALAPLPAPAVGGEARQLLLQPAGKTNGK